MRSFGMNGRIWHVVRVGPDSPALVDRTGRRTVATTDDRSGLVCLSDELSGDRLARVAAHEATHAAMVSFGLDRELAEIVPPENLVRAEEWCCNLVADYGAGILRTAVSMVG